MLIRVLLFILFFVLLTVTTQIGGVVLVLSIWLSRKWSVRFRFKPAIVFLALYLLSVFLVVPVIAPLWGREKVAVSSNLQPATYATILMNRNYVTPSVNKVLKSISQKHQIRFLDANFPFINKFPLLPHLSHNDGNKIDLSFIYQTTTGDVVNKQKSVSGYGVFEKPTQQEFNQTNVCKKQGYWLYDFPKYLTFGQKNLDLVFSLTENSLLINEILTQPEVEKVFIEPHLVSRLKLNNSKLRFHGCQAVRHDDHIHLQVKP